MRSHFLSISLSLSLSLSPPQNLGRGKRISLAPSPLSLSLSPSRLSTFFSSLRRTLSLDRRRALGSRSRRARVSSRSAGVPVGYFNEAAAESALPSPTCRPASREVRARANKRIVSRPARRRASIFPSSVGRVTPISRSRVSISYL